MSVFGSGDPKAFQYVSQPGQNTAVTGAFSSAGKTVEIDVPVSAIGGATGGDILYGLTGFTEQVDASTAVASSVPASVLSGAVTLFDTTDQTAPIDVSIAPGRDPGGACGAPAGRRRAPGGRGDRLRPAPAPPPTSDRARLSGPAPARCRSSAVNVPQSSSARWLAEPVWRSRSGAPPGAAWMVQKSAARPASSMYAYGMKPYPASPQPAPHELRMMNACRASS